MECLVGRRCLEGWGGGGREGEHSACVLQKTHSSLGAFFCVILRSGEL